MKTTTVNSRPIVNAISSSSQRGAWNYQRKPAFYPVAKSQGAAKAAPNQGQGFREILERELGRSGAAKGGAKAPSEGETETTQFLTGYWA